MRPFLAKSILTRVKNAPDPYFGGYYNVNLYRGCPHGCIYCDTRSSCYQIGDITDLRYKENALQILDDQLARKRKKGTVTTGSMNDPYMAPEKTHQLTRGALKLFAKHAFGTHIITKSDLVTRDIDVFTQVARTYAAVSLTITTADDALARVIEPHAPMPTQRFQALAQLAEHGVYAGIALMPTLPFLTDAPENILAILDRAQESGVKYVIFFPGMTLRDTCREYYYAKLDQHFPGLRQRYESRYGEQYSCNAPNAHQLWNMFQAECKRRQIATKMLFFKDKAPKQLSLFDL